MKLTKLQITIIAKTIKNKLQHYKDNLIFQVDTTPTKKDLVTLSKLEDTFREIIKLSKELEVDLGLKVGHYKNYSQLGDIEKMKDFILDKLQVLKVDKKVPFKVPLQEDIENKVVLMTVEGNHSVNEIIEKVTNYFIENNGQQCQ